jgi:carbon starvation protein
MLAAIALMLCTVVLFKMKRERYAWVTIAPTVWLVVCTVTAGVQKVFSSDPAVGFLSHAGKFTDAIAQGKILAPAKTMSEMSRIAFNDYVDATLAALFVAVVIAMVVYGVLAGIKAMRNPGSTAIEIGGVAIAAE